MFGIGMPELILILVIALIVIGPKKLPDLAKSMGRAMREFRKATSDLKDSLELDGEVRDVKSAFDDIKSDIKDSVLAESPETSAADDHDRKVADLEKAYEERNDDPGIDSAVAEGADADSPTESDEKMQPPEPEDIRRGEDDSQKDR